jgi:hypothetical protein
LLLQVDTPALVAGVFFMPTSDLFTGRRFLISINAQLFICGFMASSVQVTGSSWNGYGGRGVCFPGHLVF